MSHRAEDGTEPPVLGGAGIKVALRFPVAEVYGLSLEDVAKA